MTVITLSAQRINTATSIFDGNFHSLQVYARSNEFAPPLISLFGNDQIIVQFDEMATDRHYLRYRLIHCNADWQPSQLTESEYIDGFNQANIEDYAFSSGTFANYVHYRFAIPSEDMQILVSGNYLVQIYSEDDEDTVLLQARFYVSEDIVKIASTATSRTDIDYNQKHQQVSLRMEMQASNEDRNWWNDIKVFVTQNSREDNVAIVTHPTMFESNSVIFDHARELIFPAGNEFRRFECTQTNYPGMHIERIRHYEPYYHAELMTDLPRNNNEYNYDRTQFGRYKVRQSDAYDWDSNSDYVIVHFNLKMPQMQGGKLYVSGDMFNNRFSTLNEMRYNQTTGEYNLSALLKMGSYNYQYLWIPNGASQAQTAPVEGDHYETVNEYFTRTYYRPLSSRYDRLIGHSLTFSGK